jgi:alpha-galactosidase
LQGLDAAKQYRVTEINLMPGEKPSFRESGQTFSGDYLMKVGLSWFIKGALKSAVLELKAAG